ncbi:hypothetical protein CcaCcLH18_11745 [Colletotrichum camelliae]|nr:hypothetical protein CcaCcLH18_11745 [Colletotrichum camelliae]
MAPVFPFRYTTYGAGFGAAHDPSFPISDRPDGLMALLATSQRMKVELDRKEAAKVDRAYRPFIVQWFLPIRRWGKTLKATVEDSFKELAYPSRLLNLSIFAISRRRRTPEPFSTSQPGVPRDPKAALQVSTEILSFAALSIWVDSIPAPSMIAQGASLTLPPLLSPEVDRPEIGCYVEYAKDPRRNANPLGIVPPEEPEEDLTRTPSCPSLGSSSSDSRPSSPITAPLDSDGLKPPEDVDEKEKEEADPVSEFFDIDAYDASNSPGGPSAES